ncbi:MAG TPA: helix-turn-helix transcriptional regulator [Tepidisphaeraceae bacterium]|jgi:transcriptional regulator with XRE-family HTH domain|nr:helix-turn-helix transcriptional regulator [Tepidisphaeraceae bacterium]
MRKKITPFYRARYAKGFTQAELAAKLGVSQAAVNGWETGRWIPRLAIADELAKLLGISRDDLLELVVASASASTDTVGNQALATA